MKKILFATLTVTALASSSAFSQGCMEPSGTSTGPQVIGYVQGENITQFKANDASTNSFQFRRARIGVTGSIPYNFTYYVMSELSPTQKGPYLLDAFLTWKAAKNYFKVSAGQFKIPFGLEISTPCQSLLTYDRSNMVTKQIPFIREQGLMFSGSTDSLHIFGLEKPNLFTYSLAVVNGTGRNMNDDNVSKDIIGRLTFAPCNYFQLGASYMYGKEKNTDPTIPKADVRSRWGTDLQLTFPLGKFGILSQSEYLFAKDDGSKTEGGGCGGSATPVPGSFKSQGYYSQLLLQTPWKIDPIVKFETYDPDLDKDNFDSKSFRQDSWIFGFNYNVNDWTRLQMNYVYNVEASSSTDISKYNEIKNDMLVLQLQFKLK